MDPPAIYVIGEVWRSEIVEARHKQRTYNWKMKNPQRLRVFTANAWFLRMETGSLFNPR